MTNIQLTAEELNIIEQRRTEEQRAKEEQEQRDLEVRTKALATLEAKQTKINEMVNALKEAAGTANITLDVNVTPGDKETIAEYKYLDKINIVAVDHRNNRHLISVEDHQVFTGYRHKSNGLKYVISNNLTDYKTRRYTNVNRFVATLSELMDAYCIKQEREDKANSLKSRFETLLQSTFPGKTIYNTKNNYFNVSFDNGIVTYAPEVHHQELKMVIVGVKPNTKIREQVAALIIGE